MSNLKPCPFCGCELIIKHKDFYPMCGKCCAFQDNIRGCNAEKEWNTRPIEDRLTEENKRLREVAVNAAFVCNTFSRDLNVGFRTKDKEFAVSLLCGAVDLLSELDGDK
jgi:hypothetical protein